MMSFRDNCLWPIIVAVVSGLLLVWVGFVYFQPRPQLVFTLTEPIEHSVLRIPNKPNLRVQQIIVTNSGTAAGTNIVVAFKQGVLDPVLKKFAESDDGTVITGPSTEATYSELRPRTEFRLSFLTDEHPLDSTQIVIRHHDGEAEEASAAARPKSSDRIGSAVLWIMVGLYVLLNVASIRNSMRGIRTSQLGYLRHSMEYSALCNEFTQRPWFVTRAEWSSIMSKLLQENMSFIGQLGVVIPATGLQATSCAMVLDVERPELFGIEEWSSINEVGRASLVACLTTRVRHMYKLQDVVDRWAFRRPKYLPEADWALTMDQLRKATVETYTRDVQFRIDAELEVLSQPKPLNIESETWMEIQEIVRGNVFDELTWKLRYVAKPLEHLMTIDLSLLGEVQANELRQIAYEQQKHQLLPHHRDTKTLREFVEAGRPDWLTESDFHELVEKDLVNRNLEDSLAERTAEIVIRERLLESKSTRLEADAKAIVEKEAAYDLRMGVLEQFILEHTLPGERPNAFSEAAWRRLRMISSSWSRQVDTSPNTDDASATGTEST
jgi:hypothetical protein